MSPSKLQPAFLGGAAIGVLSALPVVNIANLCCCAWVVLGGALAAYVMQQNHPAPVSAGDGATVGLLAGVIGAILGSILAIPIGLAMGPLQADMFERMLGSMQDMPPEARQAIEQWRDNMASGAVIGIGFIFSLLFSLVFYSIFGLVGGMLGAAMFRKNVPPPPPPMPPLSPTGGFDNPTFPPPPTS